jgi:dihydroxyacetone kinase-like protein
MTDLADTEFVVRSIAQTAVDNEKEFGDLDAVVGDGDFGYSLARGFEIVLSDWDSFDRSSASAFLQKVGMVITGRIGGTSGPLWGTAFLRASMAVKGRDEVRGQDALTMLRDAIEGIKTRGKSDVGDKTLLDTLVPVADALEEEVAAGTDASPTVRRLAKVARRSADQTSMLQARRGRASYTGERSIGSPDPGAVAVAVILERLSAEWDARVAVGGQDTASPGAGQQNAAEHVSAPHGTPQSDPEQPDSEQPDPAQSDTEQSDPAQPDTEPTEIVAESGGAVSGRGEAQGAQPGRSDAGTGDAAPTRHTD